jgi:hypothetical protein
MRNFYEALKKVLTAAWRWLWIFPLPPVPIPRLLKDQKTGKLVMLTNAAFPRLNM